MVTGIVPVLVADHPLSIPSIFCWPSVVIVTIALVAVTVGGTVTVAQTTKELPTAPEYGLRDVDPQVVPATVVSATDTPFVAVAEVVIVRTRFFPADVSCTVTRLLAELPLAMMSESGTGAKIAPTLPAET